MSRSVTIRRAVLSTSVALSLSVAVAVPASAAGIVPGVTGPPTGYVASLEDAPAAPGTAATTASASTGSWLSGGSGEGVATGEFGAWRGEPATIARTWSMEALSGEYAEWVGHLNVGYNCIPDGGTLEEGAAGAYEGMWAADFAAMNTWVKAKPGRAISLSPCWEMNGDWMRWSVTPGNLAAWHANWERMAPMYRAAVPGGLLVLDFNLDGRDVAPEEIWPAAKVDVLGLSAYTDHFPAADHPQWPERLDAMRALAKAKGVPILFGEWGHKGVDDPAFIQRMHGWFAANAGTGPGQVMGDIVFNIDAGGASRVDTGATGEAYAGLVWGGPGGAVTVPVGIVAPGSPLDRDLLPDYDPASRPVPLTAAERQELIDLRAENARLQELVDKFKEALLDLLAYKAPITEESTATAQPGRAPSTSTLPAVPKGDAQPIDVLAKNFDLQTPEDRDGNGRMDVIPGAKVEGIAASSPSVEVAPDGSVTNTAPVNGAKSPNSISTRSEWKQTTTWSTTEGTHALEFTVVLTKIPAPGSAVNIAQLMTTDSSGKGEDLIQFRYNDKTKVLEVRNEGRVVATLDASYTPGEVIQGALVADNGTATVEANGQAADFPIKATDGAHFKLGSYNHPNPAASGSAASEVKILDVAVTGGAAGTTR